MARLAGEVVQSLRQKGKKIGLLRPITLWPFPKKELEKFSKRIKKFFVIEMSYGQMVEDVALAVSRKARVGFYGRAGGAIPSQKQIERELLKFLNKKEKKRGR
jgi:2-oxoglutarate ferredoxin oxidoreductase subunit alpha